jgi:predicted metal-binding membrane protein
MELEAWPARFSGKHTSQFQHNQWYQRNNAFLPACLSGCLAVPWGAVLQSKREMLENMAANKGQIKLRMDQIRKTDMGLAVQSLPEPETWNVQVFRSIDSGGEAGGARGVG